VANSRGGGKSRGKNPVTVRGDWFAIPIDFLKSRACAELSPQGIKMLMDLCAQLGRNASGNGDLTASPTIMAPRGWGSNATRVAALQELLDADLLIITRHGDRRRCDLFAITLWPLDSEKLPKLDVKPGAYTTFDWEKRSKDCSKPPTAEHPATWRALRKGEKKKEKSLPATGQPPVDMNPPRDNPSEPSPSYLPATGTYPPISAVEVSPLRDTFLDSPSCTGVQAVPVPGLQASRAPENSAAQPKQVGEATR